MSTWFTKSRRHFLGGAAAAGGSLVLSACSEGSLIPAKREDTAVKKGEEEVSPAEDLMREHGVLKRVLLICREGVRRLESRQDLPPEALASSSNLIRRFIEDYHERLEEEHLFPRFRKTGTLVELVNVLEAQHKKGRDLTDVVLQLSTAAALKNARDRSKLSDALRLFVRMYEPHEAREDTVLFPAFRKIVSPNEYDSLGDAFESKEHELFGEDGFEKNVEEVARIEKLLGIYELAQFTPA
ncbi:MAG: hemerythrin domain-containing protein [Bryobacteraceae bacterium]